MATKKTPKQTKTANNKNQNESAASTSTAVLEPAAPHTTDNQPQTPSESTAVVPAVPNSQALMANVEKLVGECKTEVNSIISGFGALKVRVIDVAPRIYAAWKAAEAASMSQVEFAAMFDPTCKGLTREQAMGTKSKGIEGNATYNFIVNTLAAYKRHQRGLLESEQRQVGTLKALAAANGISEQEIKDAAGPTLANDMSKIEEVQAMKDRLTTLVETKKPVLAVQVPTATDPEVKQTVQKPAAEVIADALKAAAAPPAPDTPTRTATDTVNELKEALKERYNVLYAELVALTVAPENKSPEAFKKCEQFADMFVTTTLREVFEALGRPVDEKSQFHKVTTGYLNYVKA